MVNDSVKISVIMSVFNGENYLKEAVDSILNQTFEAFELLIVNDGSTDSSSDILSQYRDSRVKIIDNGTNKGLIYSLNLMLSLAKGDYFARMDADDIALPDRLKIQYEFMEQNREIGVCGSFVESFRQTTGKKQVVRYPENDSGIRAFAFFQSPFCHPSTMIRKEVMNKHRLQYPDRYFKGEDYGLWIELLKYTKGATIPRVLLKYRRHEECFSGWKEIDKKVEMLSSIHKIYLSNYNIHLKDNDLLIYSRFVDRATPSELNIREQKNVSRVIRDFLTRLSSHPQELEKQVTYHLTMICFYKFIVKKKFPVSYILQKLFLKGMFIYAMRIFRIKDF